YRELNLLYTLSERLLVEPDPHTIARLALVEAGRLIDMSGGWLLLDDGDNLTALSSTGSSHALRPHSSNDDLRQQVLATREAQIVNNAHAGSYVDGAPFDHCALLCAPLKTEQRV